MARYPGAIWKQLPQNKTQPKIKVVGVVLHTAVSSSTSLFNLFNGRDSGIESTFYVRKDGKVEQYMDSDVRADCQLDGNSWLDGGVRKGFVSVETWDGYPNFDPYWKNDSDVPPWNEDQLGSLSRLVAWLADEHNFPIRTATGPHGTGVGYHRQFTTPSSSGALTWNHSHACPGDRRIAQVPGLISRAKAIQAGEDMPLTDKDIAKIWHRDGLVDAPKYAAKGNKFWAPASFLTAIANQQVAMVGQLNSLAKAVEALAGSVPPTIRDSVRAALKDATVDVDVNVSGGKVSAP